MKSKICSQCRLEHKVENYYKNKSKKDGLQNMCKSCTKKNDKKRVENGENEKRCKEKYYDSKKNDEWVETERKRKNIWRAKNKTLHNLLNKKHYNKNKIQYILRNQKRRSAMARLPFDYSSEEWEQTKALFDNRCSYCGYTGKLTQEHIIPVAKGGGYTFKNIIPACKRCNSSKRDKSLDEWYQKQTFFDADRLTKIKVHVGSI